MSQPEVPADVDFKIPSWAGKPPAGAHLDVLKGDKLMQKVMIDEKRCYFFGRNPQVCDINVEHASCSRVHAALVYHKHLNRSFLVDLGSAHGTFIGKVRLEANKPEQVMVDQSFHFGASTRRYILREKLQTIKYHDDGDDAPTVEKASARLLGLPEKEDELENLTEYNTALNRRIATMTVAEESYPLFGRKRRSFTVIFKDDEEVINPEDVDPNVGKFRNMIETAVIATKKPKLDGDYHPNSEISSRTLPTMIAPHVSTSNFHGFGPVSTKLGLSLPNIAPEIELYPPNLPPPSSYPSHPGDSGRPSEFAGRRRPPSGAAQVSSDDAVEGPKKKKYAKEAWPGKKPGQHLLV